MICRDMVENLLSIAFQLCPVSYHIEADNRAGAYRGPGGSRTNGSVVAVRCFVLSALYGSVA